MKQIIIIICAFFPCAIIHEQDALIEKEIRLIEKKRVDAFLAKDTAALLKLWAIDYTVNRPAGVVSTREQVLDLVLKDTISFESFSNSIENILVKKDFVMVMGSELTVPKGNNPDAGKTVNRRFTHIWAKQDGNWRLVARHANVLCK